MSLQLFCPFYLVGFLSIIEWQKFFRRCFEYKSCVKYMLRVFLSVCVLRSQYYVKLQEGNMMNWVLGRLHSKSLRYIQSMPVLTLISRCPGVGHVVPCLYNVTCQMGITVLACSFSRVVMKINQNKIMWKQFERVKSHIQTVVPRWHHVCSRPLPEGKDLALLSALTRLTSCLNFSPTCLLHLHMTKKTLLHLHLLDIYNWV